MKIYKISKEENNKDSPPFSIWLAKELSKFPNNIHLYSGSFIKTLQKWVNETNPDLNAYDLKQAYIKARYHYLNDKTTAETIKLNEENKKTMAELLTNYIRNAFQKYTKDVNPNTIKLIKSTVVNKETDDNSFLTLLIKFEDPNVHAHYFEAELLTKDGEIFMLNKFII